MSETTQAVMGVVIIILAIIGAFTVLNWVF